MTTLWGVLAAAALLWPARLHGLLDGVPLDRPAEAVLVGAIFPILCFLHPAFLRTRLARALVTALLAWNAASSQLLVQDGWCVRFAPSRPYAKDAAGAPHAWDVRADWQAPDPRCSAIVTRPYRDLHEFPAWFFNLPPNDDGWPAPVDRPPDATVEMTVDGFLRAPAPGRLAIHQNPDAATQIFVDGQSSPPDAALASGLHTVAVRTTLTGDQWQFVPTWDGRDLWATSMATVAKPSRLDLLARRWLAWLPTSLALALLACWVVSTARAVDAAPILIWSTAASAALAFLVLTDRADLARYAVAALGLAALVPTPDRLRGSRGVLLLVGLPWFAFAVACAIPAIGRWVLYEVGHDYWMYQRYAYRIVMQGYWLEGGSPTFWFQPFYRWIVGLLHVVFGDSSAGEWYWDAACLWAGSLFAFTVVARAGGFRWGVVAAVVPLATFTYGTAQYLIGRGLSEISSAGFVYAAALFAIRARGGNWRAALAAGVLATLAFYTRLNNLVMAAAVTVFAAPRQLRPWIRWRESLIVAAALASGVWLFAWRTWYYTGIFSVFYGTQRNLLGVWQPGMPFATAVARMASSVAMVLTVNDPPRFDLFALPVLIGTAGALLAAVRAWRFREVSPRLLVFFGAAIAGALVARGSAYPGRFSIHAIPIACAVAVCCAVAISPRHLSAMRPRTQ